ncbi:MAG: ATP-binding protein [Opitutaceae bacterium]
MNESPRVYDRIIEQHLRDNRQMIFVSGPRQVGKTTTCRRNADFYLNWDILENQRKILKGPQTLAAELKLDETHAKPSLVVFDELHKYPKWKNFLKGFFDGYGDKSKVIVTGSSRLDIFRKGGDSLMGRYFLYRMHPFSVAEVARTTLSASPIAPPAPIEETDWNALWTHGGFPEPFLKRNNAFTRRWRALRGQQLTREDMREVTQIQELGAMEVLIHVLGERSSEQVVYSNLAREVNVSVDTISRWLGLLERMHFGFLVRPWFKSVANSLRKEPKWFLRDWSGIVDDGQRAETFVGCHLLKAVEGWTDRGLGDFSLHYLRTKQKQEVDFLVVRDGKPWMLVEVKYADRSLSPSLRIFHEKLKTAHAFQVVVDLPFEAVDCFSETRPVVVPARTFLSQLV